MVCKIKEGVYDDMSDEVYHTQHSREEHFYSSSQLKTMLEDPIKFRDQYIRNEKSPTPQGLQDAFDVGTLVHTAILEPEKLKGSYVVYTGAKRAGQEWTDFKEANKGKMIINKTMKASAENAVKATNKSIIAKALFKDGQAEQSFFVNFMGIKVKVRTDWLKRDYIVDGMNHDLSAIVDLKTTTGNVRDAIKTKNKVKQLNYDLSAAFYVDVVNYCIEYFDLDIPKVETFIWVFASKDKGGYCQAYDAKAYLEMGRAKYLKAIELIKKHEANNWDFPEEIISLKPYGYELADWIETKETADNGESFL